MRRYAARRDENEAPLIALARSLGANMECYPPLDWLCGWRGRWIPVEIKRAEKAGWKSEYTPEQVLFLARCRERGLPVWVWREEPDVLRDLGAVRTA